MISDRSISSEAKISNPPPNASQNPNQLALVSTPESIFTNSDPTQENKRSTLQKRASSKMSKQTLVLTYSKDPQGFEEVLKLYHI